MIIIGIVGGLVGGYVASNVLHYGTVDGINLGSVGIAIVGAIVVLLAWRAITPRRGLHL